MFVFKGYCMIIDVIFFNFYGYVDCEIYFYYIYYFVLFLWKEVIMYLCNIIVRVKIGNEEMLEIYIYVYSINYIMKF